MDRPARKRVLREGAEGPDKAYTSIDDGIDIHQCEVAIHSFQLTASYKIPVDVLRAVAANPLIWWTKTEAELAATEMAWDAARTAGTEIAREQDQRHMNDEAAEIRDKGGNTDPKSTMEAAKIRDKGGNTAPEPATEAHANTDTETGIESPRPSSPEADQ